MNILVCVKQVPASNDVTLDPVTNNLLREGVESILNPFDLYALEGAARIKDEFPDTNIVVVTMGPLQAKSILKECLSISADKAYLITDYTFAGADTLATSYTLCLALKNLEEIEGKFDMIFCGKQSTDGDTAQVGANIAANMDYPQVTSALEVEYVDGNLIVIKEADDCIQKIEVSCPCVVTFTKPSFEPRFPNIKRKMAANRAKIPELTAADFPNLDLSRVGQRGSPTIVKNIFTPERKKSGVIISEETGEASALKLLALLSDANVI